MPSTIVAGDILDDVLPQLELANQSQLDAVEWQIDDLRFSFLLDIDLRELVGNVSVSVLSGGRVEFGDRAKLTESQARAGMM
jgi:hypothetical protein